MTSLSDVQRDALAEFHRRMTTDPLYTFRPISEAQRRFLESSVRIAIARGGNRTGKTECLSVWLSRIVRNPPPIAKTISQPVVWACEPTYEMVGEILWKQKLKKYIPAREIKGGEPIWHNRAKEWPAMVRMRNGIDLVFKSYDQGREAFQGAGLIACSCDEQVPADIFHEITRRLSDYQAPFRQAVTPIEFDEVLQNAWNEQPEGWEWCQLDYNDMRESRGGPVADEIIDSEIASIPEAFREVRVRGEFLGFAGAIYPHFSRSMHVVEPFPIPLNWQVYAGIDFGFNNPFCCLWGARDEDGGWWIFREHYEAKQTIDYHAQRIRDIERTIGSGVVRTRFADPGDPSGMIAGGKHVTVSGRRELLEHGIETVNARKEIHRGIEHVSRLLMDRGDGQPNLRIFSTCTNLIREMPNYRWTDPPKTGGRNPADAPLSKENHAVDALRYLLFSWANQEADTPPRIEGAQSRFAGARSNG